MEREVTTATWGSPLPCKQALRGQTPNLAFYRGRQYKTKED